MPSTDESKHIASLSRGSGFTMICNVCGNTSVGVWTYHTGDYDDYGVRLKCSDPECKETEDIL